MTTNQKRQKLALHCNVILAAPHNYDAMLVEMAEAMLDYLAAAPEPPC